MNEKHEFEKEKEKETNGREGIREIDEPLF